MHIWYAIFLAWIFVDVQVYILVFVHFAHIQLEIMVTCDFLFDLCITVVLCGALGACKVQEFLDLFVPTNITLEGKAVKNKSLIDVT